MSRPRDNLIEYTLDYFRLSSQALSVVDSIRETFDDSMDTHKNAWGQYVDPPRHRDHVGIYGTSSAVKILGSGNTDEYIGDIERAQSWLVNDQWEDKDSPTIKKGHLQYSTNLLFY